MRAVRRNPSQWKPAQRWERQGFRIRLLCVERAPRALTHGAISELIASLPSKPAQYCINSIGSDAAELVFYQWRDILDAIVHLWSLRLAGSHRLVPVLESSAFAPSNKTEMEARLKSVFSGYARKLLESDAVLKCEKKILDLKGDINKVASRLRKRNSLVFHDELTAKKKNLEAELALVKSRLGEFRAAVECVLAYLGESKNQKVEKEEVDDVVQLFRFGTEFDWRRIHLVLERECQRLEAGLPIYGCRRDILRTIKFNQVTVLIGETGSGKSTQLVQFLADSGLTADGSIVCTQPRRIAALSLGRRVREESYGCYVDNFVTTYATYVSSQVFGPKIIYMTDYCLLQHCMNNMSLSGISYIIVDEAHERNLNTDLLLALVKKQLLDRSDLRLIIMSATADANKFAEYFYDCSTFIVKGRSFPVEIKYIPDVTSEAFTATPVNHKPVGFAPYVSDAVKMARFIHCSEGDGAILVFLTSQMEVEFACENFGEPTVVVLPFHGKLPYEEQNRVFEIYPGKRKVIFCTNVAETSLTIQDVKYVIDCGMEKESRFEPSSGMNVLKVCWISQSSANQRAGRAGRTGPGKCYRLYSESDFQLMRIHQEPEIRKVHLGNAVLRILALGIKKVQDFEFVDAPSSEAIDKALQNLVHLGAIRCKNGTFELTDIGLYLVKLGIEPRLGKMILDCFTCGLKKEGLVLAAVMTHASNMFCRVGTEEEKYRADRRKLPFCHNFGDLFTLLSVYKKWEDDENKNKWCWLNSINAKSLRRCQDTVLELERSLRHELNIIIPSYWLWNPNETSMYDKALKWVILSSLSENVAMYSGYDRLGYEVALTGQHLQLHPSCSLLAYGQKPNWVVFCEILSLANQYLVCVTAVDHECLHKIQPPLFDIMQLQTRKMEMNLISGLGNNLLRRLCGKQTLDLQRIVSCLRNLRLDDRISIDVDFEKGELQMFASAKDMEKVSHTVGTALHFEKKRLMEECIEKCLYHTVTGHSSPLALFGSGAEIKHLELDNRYLAVEISHENAHDLDDKELLMMVDQFAPGMANFHKHVGSGPESEDLSKWGKIIFVTPEAAGNAVAKLNELEWLGSMLKVVPASTGEHFILPFPAVKVRLSWPRRPSKGVALVRCAEENANFIINDCSGLEIGGKFIHCDLSTKHKNCIFVTGIPKDISESELSNALRSATKRTIIDVHLLRGESSSDLPNSTYAKALMKEIAPFMPNKQFHADSFRVEVFNPEMKDYMMKALITFDGSLHLEAAKALDHIQGKVLSGFLSWQKIECQHMFYSSLSCPRRVYSVIKKDLDSLLRNFKLHKGVSFKLDETEGGAFRLKVFANASKVIADLRKPLEQLMKGKSISHPGLTPNLMQVLRFRDGVALMSAVERETRTYIMYDRQNLNVKVFGPPEQVIEAEEKLINALLSFHENKQLEIRLRGGNRPPGLMKEVVQRFGSDLQGLKEKVPGIELVLNTRQHTLLIKGSKDLKKKVEDVISEVIQYLDSEGRMIGQLSEELACPICLCEPEEPYKLESCGHVFCQACLIDQFESVIKYHDGFPICCTKEVCKDPILLVDLRNLLTTDKLEQLFRASLGAFVAASQGTYRFCPTPDCPSIYRVAPKEAATGSFECPVCSTETCTKCHIEYHPFISCERYMEFKEHPDLSLESWRKGKEKEQVKDCPCCRHTIEKVDGCNHIECRCGKHLCWVCLEWFSISGDCYNHINSKHPIIG